MLFDYILKREIQPIGFCPIGSPTRPDRDKTPQLRGGYPDAGDRRDREADGVHPAVICIKWAVQRGQTPIPFSVFENEYTSNLRCIVEDPLSSAEMESIRRADKNCRLIKGQVFLGGREGLARSLDENGTITK